MMESEEDVAQNFTLSHYVKEFKDTQLEKDFIWCLDFATVAHKNQKRKDIERTPYINHLIGVAHILSDEAGITNLDILRGALLHDTVEDTPVVIEDIYAKFGNWIGSLIDEVTDDKSLPKQKRKNLQVMHSHTSSPQAKIVKLADKLYNLRDLLKALPDGWTEQRREEYFKWAFHVCEGLRGINSKLEERLDAIFILKGLISHKVQSQSLFESFPWPNHDELKPIVAAANFAAGVHKQHFVFDDKNNEPFINHAVSMALFVSQEAEIQDITVLCATLLHAVIGKANLDVSSISNMFSKEVGNLVKEVTYSHSLTVEKQFKVQMELVDRMSHNAKVITLSAIIDNCRRLELRKPESWSLELQDNYLKWCKNLCNHLLNTDPQLDKDILTLKGLLGFPVEFPKEVSSEVDQTFDRH